MMANPAAAESRNVDAALLLRVLEEVASRRRKGDACTDEGVMAAHPNLMPELGVMLSAMSFTEKARELASISDSDTENHDFSNGSFLLRGDGDHNLLGRLARDMFRGYELGEIIGRGASGVVYRAVQTSTGREVAIKVLMQGTFESHSEEARFEREAHILAQLKHPNIVTVYDTGWSSGRFFLVMDYVRGQQLDQWLRRASPTLEEKVRMFEAIAETVHAAHLRGVIHRDLKPRNIRIDERGEPHLLDFGLAKVLDSSGEGATDIPGTYAHSMTMTGQFVGSLPWASPEQAEGAPQKIDIRTDVYSLGVIFYQALTGLFPYTVVGNIRDVIDRILTAAPTKLRTIRAELDEEIEIIVLTCLSKERDRRYQSAGELAQDLRHWLADEPIAAKRDSGLYILRRAIHHHRLVAGIFSAFVLFTVVFGVAMSILYGETQREGERSRRTLAFLQDTLFQASSHRLGSDATVTDLLDQASPRIRQQFSEEPAIEAALQYTVGNAYQSLWRHGNAIPHLKRSLALCREAFGSDHPDTLKSMIQLAIGLAEVRDGASVPLFEEALVISRNMHGNRHPMVAEVLGGLAYAKWTSLQPPRWEEAEALYQQSIAMFREFRDRQNPAFPRTLTGYGFMLSDRNENVKAEIQLREASELSERFLGNMHQYTLESLMGLSDVLVDLDRLDEAQEVLDKLYPLVERQLGARVMPSILRRTVYLQMARRQYEDAERTLFEIQAAVCNRLVGERAEHSEQLNKLATKLREGAGRRGADEVFIEGLDATQALIPDALESARALLAMGMIRHNQVRYASAEMFLRRCRVSLDEIKAPTHVLRMRAARTLAASLRNLGREEEAESLLRDTLAALQQSLGPEDHLSRQVANDLHLIYRRSARTEEAKALPASANR